MIFYDPWTSLVILLFALGLDRWLGEPFIYHPLVGFSRLAAWLGAKLGHEEQGVGRQYWLGVVALLILLLPLVTLVAWLDTQVVVGAVVDILLLYLALSLRKLREDSEAIIRAQQRGDLSEARQQLGLWVPQNTVDMDTEELNRACVETILENGNKAVLASLFWFLLAGGAGVLLHRLGNTLAVMWGDGVGGSQPFARAALGLDRLLNYVPARLTVLLYALVVRRWQVIGAASRQGRQWQEGNDGVVMAAGATALGLVLGGGRVFGRPSRQHPVLGRGAVPTAMDIPRALRLVGRSVQLLIWLQLAIAGGWSLV